MEENNYTSYQYQAPQEPPKKPKKRGTGWVIALALCFALLGGVIGGSRFCRPAPRQRPFCRASARM